jgi:mRNA-degrading endonuclease toxin of MazEF toxin-antitoxin module
VLTSIVVAPVSHRSSDPDRGPALGEREGLAVECVASFEHLQRIGRSMLTERVGDLGQRRVEICEAIRALADC